MEERSMHDDRNMTVLERMAEGFSRKDIDQIVACFAEDGVFETSQGPDPWGERFQGRAAIREAVANVFKVLPDMSFAEATRWVCGDRGVSEWTCIATTPKGHRLEARGCDLFTFRDGKVARKDTYFKQVARKK
jgi:ketosteroid isomerase-like protein